MLGSSKACLALGSIKNKESLCAKSFLICYQQLLDLNCLC